MGINGLTNTDNLRRTGKIRSGFRDDATGKMTNTPYFMLHEVPELIPILGEQPTEIYFTVFSNNPYQIMQADLRWYSKTGLQCRSVHEALDENNQPLGQVAAYSALGSDVVGLTQRPFPRIANARVRVCGYKTCPDYVQGRCSEHMFLNFYIPQHSLTSIYTLDTTSINAVINADSALKRVLLGNEGGRLRGEVFKLFKKNAEISYTDIKAGKIYKSDKPVVHVEPVPFEEYEAKFKSSINPRVWNRLLEWRSGSISFTEEFRLAPGFADAAALTGSFDDEQTGVPQIAGAAPSAPAVSGQSSVIVDPQENERLVKEAANKPEIMAMFDELSKLMGVENSEENRIKTAAHYPGDALRDYLSKRLAAARKTHGVPKPQARDTKKESATKVQAPTENVVEHAPPGTSGPEETPLF